jgi:hypothetical protein
MKKHLYLSIIVVVLLSLAGWTGYARGQRSVGRQTWEYHVDPVPGTQVAHNGPDVEVYRTIAAENERLINQRAAEGWELTAVGASYFYFRRARQ